MSWKKRRFAAIGVDIICRDLICNDAAAAAAEVEDLKAESRGELGCPYMCSH
jgi:hypothetical protein